MYTKRMLNENVKFSKVIDEIATTYNLEDSEYGNTFARDSIEISPLKVNDSIESKVTS